METLKFVIVGHVDHGKSTLIGRLLYDTGSVTPERMEEIKKAAKDLGRETEFSYLLDHLEEERQQGITIETTQMFFKTENRQYVIIDAPGHAEFIKNMITGASSAEAAVLIIDANEGIKEQTKRHAYILSLLGITQIIVAVNKMDISGYDEKMFEEIKKNIKNFLKSIALTPAFCIPISALKGVNLIKDSGKTPWYGGPMFLESLGKLKCAPSSDEKPMILPVQDIYKIGGKRIAVGRIEGGTIREGESIKILPQGQTTRIKSIEKYPKTLHKAVAGESIGLTTEDSIFLDRGDIICKKGEEPVFANRFNANIFWISKEPFRKGDKLSIKSATQETTCIIEKIQKRVNSSSLEIREENASTLENLEVGEVVISTKKAIALKKFSDVQEMGRFVLIKNNDTCAGGIVTRL